MLNAAMIRAMAQQLNMDAAATLYLTEQLTEIEAKLHETPFAPMKADILVPPQNIGRGARQWGFDRITAYGIAKFFSLGATDYPLVGASKVRVTFPIKEAANGYEFTHKEVLAAQMAKVPLEQTSAKAARRGHDVLRNETWLAGNSDAGYTGLFNDPGVPRANALTGGWGSATPDQKLADLNEIARWVFVNTKEEGAVDTLVMSPEKLSDISSTPRATTSETSILAYFLKNQDWIKSVETSTHLTTAGVGGTQRMMAYKRDQDVVAGPISILFEALQAQLRGFVIHTPCYSSFGGVTFKAPVYACYRDGI